MIPKTRLASAAALMVVLALLGCQSPTDSSQDNEVTKGTGKNGSTDLGTYTGEYSFPDGETGTWEFTLTEVAASGSIRGTSGETRRGEGMCRPAGQQPIALHGSGYVDQGFSHVSMGDGNRQMNVKVCNIPSPTPPAPKVTYLKDKIPATIVHKTSPIPTTTPSGSSDSIVGGWGTGTTAVYTFTSSGQFITGTAGYSVTYVYTASGGNGQYWMAAYPEAKVPFTYTVANNVLSMYLYGSTTPIQLTRVF